MSGTTPKNMDFPLVGVGASAGGVESFKRFLSAIPDNTGMAFILIQHLSPNHESVLPKILSRATSLPVHEITDNCIIEPDNVYVLPENKLLEITDHSLKLSPRKKNTQNMPVDLFLTSLAKVHRAMAMGVVLSGTDRDGTEGLKAIKEQGGITFVEDPDSAAWDGMPRNAIDAGVVDFVLETEKIPSKIVEVSKSYASGEEDLTAEETTKDIAGFKRIIHIIGQHSGVDFTYYKQPTLQRRIHRRMAIKQVKSYTDYLQILKDNKAEKEALFQDFLIKVTSFFRDPDTFQKLSEDLFPRILREKADDEPIRIWVVGCATGEEVYSLAISLFEVLGGIPAAPFQPFRKIQIFASDISETAVSKAREGVYSALEIQPLSATQRKNYFQKTDGNYKVIKPVRDAIVFASHNFLKDPPFGKVDLISCRNVFIYLEPFLQKKVLTTFHYALRENAYLLLGKSETTGLPLDLFTPYSKRHKIYSRKPGSGRFEQILPPQRYKEKARSQMEESLPLTPKTDFKKSAEALLISRYTPASVIINDHMEVVHINGTIAPFLAPPSGKPNFELMKMARKELAFELRNAVHKAKISGETFSKRNIPVKFNNDNFRVSIQVIPLADVADPHYLVLFEKNISQDPFRTSIRQLLAKIRPKTQYNNLISRNESLKNELELLREDMRAITEDQAAQNEELQSANEELQSANEEMQSLNEELETSKEELQSTNEELIVVNRELIEKQGELHHQVDFSLNLIATLREPFVVLNKDMRIQTTNAAFRRKFEMEESELSGKYFFEIQDDYWNHEDLRSVLYKLLPKKERIVNQEISIDLPSKGEHIYLLNAREVPQNNSGNKLILLSIDDITERRKTEKDHLATIDELNQVNQQMDQFIHVASHDLQEPLRKILTFSSRLLNQGQKELSKDMMTYLEKIQSSSVRMTALIKNLLNYCQLTNYEPLFEKVDLNDLVNGILLDFELLVEQKKAKIEIGELPTIMAIPQQINQLFYNLLSNALKFTKKDTPPVVEISTRTYPGEKVETRDGLNPGLSYVEILVKDNGIGFSPSYSQQIFNIFQRLHNSSEYQGTGIGLALSKKIVENHNGRIYAESEEGKSATFHVILPQTQPEKT